MTKFATDTTYSTRKVGDFRVISRTEKTVEIFSLDSGDSKKCRIQNFDGVEFVYPEGKYSQCPVLKAA